MKSLIIGLALAITSSSLPLEQDVVFQAMKDELDRSITQLKVERHDKPYYVSYRLDDFGTLHLSASFGGLDKNELSRMRMFATDVHVGSNELDSGNMSSWRFAFRRQRDSISLDDDYDAIRHELWLLTDESYKEAVKNLERKKGILQHKTTKDRPDDWSKEEAAVLVEPLKPFEPHRQKWADEVKSLSEIFKHYPAIKDSAVSFSEISATRYFINNEGSKSRVNEATVILSITARAQAKDGMSIADTELVTALSEDKMLSQDALSSKVTGLAERLTQVTTAKDTEAYEGPVLFEGDSAAQFFSRTLAPNLVVRRPSDELGAKMDLGQSRIGRRILPSFIDVTDDPDLRDSSGDRLPGYSEVDEQGVPCMKVSLVEKGMLKTLLSTRLPSAKVKKSNGHALNYLDTPRISNLVVENEEPLDRAALRAKLLELGKEQGLDYVLIVRRLSGGQLLGRHGEMPEDAFQAFSPSRRDRIELPIAVDCVRVNVADGKEEPLRAVEFAPANVRILQDIVAAGNDGHPYPADHGLTTITAPSIIVKNVEIEKSRAENEKPPALPHPFFDKAASP